MFRPSATASDDPAISVQVLLPSFNLPVQRHQDPQLEKPRNRVRLGDLLEVNPENYQVYNRSNSSENQHLEAMVLSEMFNLQAKGHRRTSNTKMQNHGPQETPDFRQRHQDPQLEKPRNRVRLGDLLEVNPENYQVYNRSNSSENQHLEAMVLSEMFNLQAKGHRRTSNTKMQNHGPQETPDFRFSKKTRRQTAKVHFDTGSTSRRPDFILDAVLDPKPMALPPPSLNPATPTHTFVSRNDKNQR
ncbi:hypothetical protein Tco_0515360 [Tanacetum coccineum]